MRSTQYIIGFAVAICLVCSVFVAGSAVLLKPRQEANKILDKQKKVLDVAGLLGDEELTPEAITKLFADNIVARAVTLKTGKYDGETDLATFDQQKAKKDPELGMDAPKNAAKVLRIPKTAVVYHVMKGDQVDLVILPIEGKGLWSTLYGFLALEADATTVRGITFYQHGETPGLGGEIDNPRWKGLWVGRKAFDAADKPVINVIKGMAGSVTEDPHQVDGLSGATITGRGVGHLVQFWLGEDGFGPYLANFRQQGS